MNSKHIKYFLYFYFFCFHIITVFGQGPREVISLNDKWQTVMHEHDTSAFGDFEKRNFEEKNGWKAVDVPHNWDQYDGYRRLIHGNVHGYAWYRKKFKTPKSGKGKRYYLFFEGVGSYATVWLNGKRVGYHAGGRTTFTLDVTDAILKAGEENILAVRADHPAEIRDLPWVDGGCSPERGFSEGSQPLGIFRPVSLIVKNEVNIIPFGMHYWNDEQISSQKAAIQQTVEMINTTDRSRKISVRSRLLDQKGREIQQFQDHVEIGPGKEHQYRLSTFNVSNPTLWSTENPYLYRIETTLIENKKILDQVVAPYGIRKISWPKGLKPNGTNQLFVNDKPIFIHGIAEYEHKFGNSHAFSEEEVLARVSEMKSLGFNSFRDAHQPHNLRYQAYWDQHGVLLWTQMAAHIWFDNPSFRANFKKLLKQWVRERRNNPSVFLWGLQNESTLPEDFAAECTALIRELDPTASIQRLVTTCNGGSGTDWDVPQNWTGTYGGHHNTYAEDLKRQVLVGEYGAWRSLELHAEPPYLPNHNIYSEERFTEILETKLRLADSVKDETIGHYQWLWTSHDNPGRVQGGEGYRDIDKIGPVNYKGLLTPWLEPTDAYFMYRANYAPKEDPMIYISSHTWPNRWREPGIKNNIRIYSNCDEVELFNDMNDLSLGIRKRGKIGTHFEFNDVLIKYNVLYAVGRIDGKVVARDTIVLQLLPQSPKFTSLLDSNSTVLQAQPNLHYHYRINAGGPAYTDGFGQVWSADRPYDGSSWGSGSWTDDFKEINPIFASQRRVFDPIRESSDWDLFQTFRYGLDKMGYTFHLPNGQYEVELYFAEPWIGTGGILDGSGRRVFDIALNGQTVEERLDIWKEVGHDHALKKSYTVQVTDGKLTIDFPKIHVGQAVIHAIAIASRTKPSHSSLHEHYNLTADSTPLLGLNSWLDIGTVYNVANQKSIFQLASILYGSDYFQVDPAMKQVNLQFKHPTNFYVIADTKQEGYEDTGEQVVNSEGGVFSVYRKILKPNEPFTWKRQSGEEFFAFQRLSGIEPAYDLKKTVGYKANQTKIYSHVKRVNFQEQERLQFEKSSGSMVGWEISVGVADVYALTFKYHNAGNTPKKGWYEVLSLDGTILKSKTPVIFEPTRSGKWNYLNENTSTMINAGSYIVKIYSEDAEGIYIDNLDVQ
ncbi:protein of unknown function [Sphingobacterium lactis]|uniref:Glycosyl hydrolases family 2, TIM barrel domain n=2 Tax=Sphingobacterium lactis TaxID=797291 RepID=A0A1H6C4F0_9SPHI|nr:protein of unknown function [Sphingobacterium lactis]